MSVRTVQRQYRQSTPSVSRDYRQDVYLAGFCYITCDTPCELDPMFGRALHVA